MAVAIPNVAERDLNESKDQSGGCADSDDGTAMPVELSATLCSVGRGSIAMMSIRRV